MANRITAINAYRPRIKKGKMANVKEAANLIAGRTSLNESGVHEALLELKYVLGFFLKSGRSLKLPGLGLFSPHMSLNGRIKVSLRLDKEVTSELNKEDGGFDGEVINSDMKNKTSDELVTRWNEEHPEDPVVET
ncbi:MAG: hypothetical protein PVH61_14650 [Candidatus Aminicenantes bacterium]|jgi:hypothetical protein